MTAATEILDRINNVVGSERVFAPATTHEGITVIPASSVTGGGGGGGGTGGDASSGEGDGGGFGLIARPSGALVIADGKVRWKPTVDFNRIIAGGQMLGAVYFLSTWLIERSKARSLVKIAKHAKAVSNA